ncbi:MAG TPA: ABC transporter permease [Candidatus Dormibacteraeota bacterium]
MIAIARQQWRGFRAATWLGFLINSNWVNPVIFAIYSVLRPLSAAFILVVMYRVISGNASGTAAYLAFLVTGAAFWSFVQYGFAGLSNGITEDRGDYRMLKYVYISSLSFYIYLFGRALAQLGSAVASTLVVLIVATIALRLPIDLFAVNYPLLIVGSAIALVAVVAMAMAFGLFLLRMVDAHGYGELGAAFLYMISGAIFPITVLPTLLATIASLIPLAYWMEIVRRSLLGTHAIRMFPTVSDGEIVLRLLATTIATVLVSFLVFGWADRSARGRGLIDRESNW